MMTRSGQIRIYVILCLVGINLVACLTLVYFLYQSQLQYELRAQTLSQNLSAAVEQSLAKSIEKIELGLNNIIYDLAFYGDLSSNRDINGFLAGHKEQLPEVEGFRISDASGRVIYGNGLGANDQVMVEDRDFFIQHRDHDDRIMRISKPLIGRISLHPIMIFSRRLNGSDGKFAGVIHATVRIDYFYRLIAHFNLESRSSIVLRDEDFGLITRYPAIPDRPVGQIGNNVVSPDLRALSGPGVAEATYFTAQGPDGFERIWTFRRLPGAPIMVLAGVARSDYMAGWYKELSRSIAIELAFLLASLVAGAFFFRLIAEGSAHARTLRISQERLNQAQHIARLGSYDWDPIADRLEWSDEHFRLWGLEPNAVKPDFALYLSRIHPDDVERVKATIARAHQEGGQCSFEHRLLRPDGSEHCMRSQGLVVQDETGRPIRMLGTVLDITDRKRVEHELQVYRDHLEELVASRTAELEAARSVAEIASQAKTSFVANMSHELRTPLSAIIGMTEISLSLAADIKLRAQLAKIKQASHLLLSIINDVLDISKIEAGSLQLETIGFTFARVLDNLTNLIEQRIVEKGLNFSVECDPKLAALTLGGDPMRLSQILINLTSNAVKFTETGSVKVTIRLAEEDPYGILLRCEVADTGIGINEAAQKRLFVAFEQADGSMTRRYGGTGLGLAISKRLVALMGGEIGVTSREGEGSLFWFTARLEKRIASSPAIDRVAGSLCPEQLIRRDFSGAAILLAEDEPINQEISKWLLENVGLAVDLVENGADAVALARAKDYRLILMDMQMPVLNGIDAARQMRLLPHHRSTPILAMTANAFEEDRQICLAAGMNDHIGKPVDAELLYERLCYWLNLAATDQADLVVPVEPTLSTHS